METEAVIRVGWSRNYPVTSGRFQSERTGVWPEKSEHFPVRNTASMKSLRFPSIHRFLAELFDLFLTV
jgi:hypothetical protein